MIIQRSYNPESDFERINQFLRDCYEPENANGNWFQTYLGPFLFPSQYRAGRPE